MKFFFDENVSPHHARAMANLSKIDGGNTKIVALKDKFKLGTPDHEWIQALSDEGDWVIITKDRFSKNSLEAQVFKNSGLTTFMMDKAWGKKRYWDQIIQFIRWWPEIQASSLAAARGTVFELPWGHRTGKKVKPKR